MTPRPMTPLLTLAALLALTACNQHRGPMVGMSGTARAEDRPMGHMGSEMHQKGMMGQGQGQMGMMWDRDRPYGWRMMSEAERDDLHRRISQAKTEEERQVIMNEHRRRMHDRAQLRGLPPPTEEG